MTHRQPLQRQARGFTLIELCLATAMGALLLAALVHVARLATESKAELSGATEQRLAAEFVLQRLRTATRSATVDSLNAPANGDTEQWLAPKRFCINSAKALVETSASDDSCSSGEVIADQVSRLTITTPTSQSALDAPIALLTVVLPLPDGTDGLTVSQSIRLKGLLE